MPLSQDTSRCVSPIDKEPLLGSWDPARFSVEDAGTAYLVFPDNRSMSLTAAFALNQAEDKRLQLRAHGTQGGATLFPLALHTEMAGELADVQFPFLPSADRQLANTVAFLDAYGGRPSTICTAAESAQLQGVMDRLYVAAGQSG